MADLLQPLQSLEEERNQLFRYLDGLDAAQLSAERADLAGAIAVLGARYENVLTDAFYPQIVESLGMQTVVAQGDDLMKEARHAISIIRDDLRDVAPINAHANDADLLDARIDAMANSLRALLAYEDAELFKLIDQLDADDVAKLRTRIDEAAAHQTSLPELPDNRVVRKFAEYKESLGLALNDHSTEWHPGLDSLDESPE
jgi:hypothetical protein